MTLIKIPQHEVGTTRVFSLSMTATEAQQLRDDPAQQAEKLGAAPQNPTGVEVFELADLGDLGLAGYLRDGVDAIAAEITRDQTKLAALEGWVLLVHSSAFAKLGATLTPAVALTLIGTYAQTPSETAQFPLKAEAAQSSTVTAQEREPAPRNPQPRGSWVVIAAALILITGLWLTMR